MLDEAPECGGEFVEPVRLGKDANTLGISLPPVGVRVAASQEYRLLTAAPPDLSGEVDAAHPTRHHDVREDHVDRATVFKCAQRRRGGRHTNHLVAELVEHRRRTDPARRERLMDAMQQAAERGAALTKQLLAFARRQVLKPEPLDIAQQIGGMRDLLDRSLRDDVQVAFELARDLRTVEVDPGALELAVLNLAVNARDAMPAGGMITVGAENCPAITGDGLNGDYVRLSVSDTGTGMTPEVLALVFEPFYTTKDVGKGSGLGLAQVHGFASQSHGAVRIDSVVGRGTTINIYLPRSDKVPREQHYSVEPMEPSESRSAGSVLLVEDDNEVAKLASEMQHLQPAGDHRQQVVEIVSDAACELADRFDLLGLTQSFLDAGPLIHLPTQLSICLLKGSRPLRYQHFERRRRAVTLSQQFTNLVLARACPQNGAHGGGERDGVDRPLDQRHVTKCACQL